MTLAIPSAIRWQRGVLRRASARADREGDSGTHTASPLGAPVVKLGGSLLARPDWPADVAALVAHLEPGALLVVGGGAVVDGLRTLDTAAPLPSETVHLLAIDSMGITARAVAAVLSLPLSVGPGGSADLGPATARRDIDVTTVLDTPRWLRDGGLIDTLPVGWHVTSDSIAALVATKLHRRLLLVKSVPPPDCAEDLETLAERGWIDGFFPRAALAIPRIEWAAPCSVTPRETRGGAVSEPSTS